MINKKLNILMVEDQITDASLIQRQVNKCFEDCEIRLVDSLFNFRHALKTFVPDFVLTDYQLIGFTAENVMEELYTIHNNIPVIVITGTLNNEELAAKTILNGASAFLLKADINKLHTKLLPIFEALIDEKATELKRLAKKRKEREKLDEIHTILKQASNDKIENSASMKDYYQKLLQKIDTNIKSILN